MVRKFTIKEFRVFKAILQNDIAFHIGLSQSAYSLIENGFRKTSLRNYEKIANYLNVPVNSVINNEIEITYVVITSIDDKTSTEDLEIIEILDTIQVLIDRLQKL
jgi:transcriptional regulator with XRE-family HTH domain